MSNRVPSENTPQLFPDFIVLQSGIEVDLIVIFFVNDLHKILCNVKAEEKFEQL